MSENPVMHLEFRRMPCSMSNSDYSVLTVKADGRFGTGPECDNLRQAVAWRDANYPKCELRNVT